MVPKHIIQGKVVWVHGVRLETLPRYLLRKEFSVGEVCTLLNLKSATLHRWRVASCVEGCVRINKRQPLTFWEVLKMKAFKDLRTLGLRREQVAKVVRGERLVGADVVVNWQQQSQDLINLIFRGRRGAEKSI